MIYKEPTLSCVLSKCTVLIWYLFIFINDTCSVRNNVLHPNVWSYTPENRKLQLGRQLAYFYNLFEGTYFQLDPNFGLTGNL